MIRNLTNNIREILVAVKGRGIIKNNARPQILDPLESIDEYDTIYLGYPNWWSTMPTIVIQYLDK